MASAVTCLIFACADPPPASDRAEAIVRFGLHTAAGLSPEGLTDPLRGHPFRAAGGPEPCAWVVVGDGPDGQPDVDPSVIWRAAVDARNRLVADWGADVRFDLRQWSAMKRAVEAPHLDVWYDPTNGVVSRGDEIWGEIDESPLFASWPVASRARLAARLAATAD